MRIAIMPARGGSKRIARKNAADFCGRPLLTYALEAARQAGIFDTIHVSTEDSAIAQIAADYGFPPEFMRDPSLADDLTPLVPVMKWILERFAERGRKFDSVCLVMATAPLIDADDIRDASALFEAHKGKFGVVAVSPMPCPVEWAMRIRDDARIEMIDLANAYRRSQDLGVAYYDSGTIALFPPQDILAYPNAQTEFLAHVIPRYKAVDIDNPEDLELAKRLYRGRA